VRQLDFRDHRRELDDNRYIYAVVSRRSGGLSIGVNLNPDKFCTFDCPYCQVDRTVPGGPKAVDLGRLDAELSHLLGLVRAGTLWSVPPFDTAAPALRRVNDIAFAGDGEPTAAPSFAAAVEAVGRLRATFGLPDVKILLLTNATLFHRPAVARGLAALDALGGEIWAKLDAGTPSFFARVDGTAIPFGRVLTNLRDAAIARPITLQCLFYRDAAGDPPPAERDAWGARIAEILAAGGQIREVQVTTIARRTAQPGLDALPADVLDDIAARPRALGLQVRVIPGIPAAPTPES
jgi:pyruvate-formate lyase-activating enzyme